MLEWVVNKVWPLVEPKLEKLVRDAVDEAVKDITDTIDTHVDGLQSQAIALLKKLPIVGGLI